MDTRISALIKEVDENIQLANQLKSTEELCLQWQEITSMIESLTKYRAVLSEIDKLPTMRTEATSPAAEMSAKLMNHERESIYKRFLSTLFPDK